MCAFIVWIAFRRKEDYEAIKVELGRWAILPALFLPNLLHKLSVRAYNSHPKTLIVTQLNINIIIFLCSYIQSDGKYTQQSSEC